MSTEVQIESEETLPPPIDVDTEVNGKAPRRIKNLRKVSDVEPAETTPDDEPAKAAPAPVRESEDRETRKLGGSSELKKLANQEDMGLRQLVESFGADGAYKIAIARRDPTEVQDPATGKLVTTGGHLTTVEEVIDEDWLLKRYGGGTYALTFKSKDQRGSFVTRTHRTVKIAGEPNLTALPRSAVQIVGGAVVAGPPPENEKLVTKAFDMMASQIAEERRRADHQPKDTGESALVRVLETQLAAQGRQMDALRAEMREMANKPAPSQSAGDQMKDKLLDKLIDQDSARLQSVRMQYESELRQVKEIAAANEQRLRDSFEREREQMRTSQERELARLTQSHDLMMATIRASYDSTNTATKSSHETNLKITESEVRKLERDNDALRVEVKELKAKKDKSLIEQVTEIEKVKEALGLDGDNDKTTADKLIELATNPEAISAVAGMFTKKEAPAAPVQQQAPAQPQIFVGPGGKRFAVDPNSGQLIPLKRRVRQVAQQTSAAEPAAEGTTEDLDIEQPPAQQAAEPTVPEVAPEDLERLIAYFEGAYNGGQEPEIVAQSVRSRLPEDVLGYLRDRMAEHGTAQGVDVFLAKVAKLPSTSPLSNQAGRNWVRKLCKALVGE
jgi:hypothetical protein